ncbi:MAG: DeoR-like helix-turn-helix domain protein [Syntrophorhabdaceae bacterium PtaU1.Bin034]|nr:MAG: DeoR-like helix-turn-helix domain protein [Syntrophorhabdaceae bacterium PtaU1.Bin034]
MQSVITRLESGAFLPVARNIAQLHERQRKIAQQVIEDGFVTAGWCMKNLQVVRDTARRDLTALVKLGILIPKGAGRGAQRKAFQRLNHPIIIRQTHAFIRLLRPSTANRQQTKPRMG